MSSAETAPSTSATDVFDLVIIGSGSGNTIPDHRFDDRSIAIIDKGQVNGAYGGTCLNVGCIPTKMFVWPADVAEESRHGHQVGVDATVTGTRWADIRDRVFGRIDRYAASALRYRVSKCPNITVFQQQAHFLPSEPDGLHRLALADGSVVVGREVVVAVGSRAVIPAAIEGGAAPFHTNDTVMRLERLPDHVIVVGGGYIAAEFAHVFSGLGSKVTLIVRGTRLLSNHDESISDLFTDIAARHWDVRFSTEVRATRSGSDGGVEVDLSDGSTLTGDVLLVATGRVSNADTLATSNIGIELDGEGRLPVDKHQRTSVRGVWALGDVSTPYPLKHVANHEARVVAENVLAGWDAVPATTDHRFVPSAVFSRPQVASVGLTERQAREQNIDVAVAVKQYSDIAYGWAMGDLEGMCKLIADRSTGRLVGAHLLGYQASALIQSAISAMSFGIPAHEFARGQYWIHPALPELVENALLGLDED